MEYDGSSNIMLVPIALMRNGTAIVALYCEALNSLLSSPENALLTDSKFGALMDSYFKFPLPYWKVNCGATVEPRDILMA